MGRGRLLAASSPPLIVALALLTAGCSGTPFGEQLSRSFSAPPAAPTGPSAPSGGTVQRSPAVSQPPKPPPPPPKAPPARPAKRPSAAAPPAPYRITLRLPGADPSAPAEAVTEALRAAGLSFEVEMIERVRGPETATPTVTPAPAPR